MFMEGFLLYKMMENMFSSSLCFLSWKMASWMKQLFLCYSSFQNYMQISFTWSVTIYLNLFKPYSNTFTLVSSSDDMAVRFFLSTWKVYLSLIFSPQQIYMRMQMQAMMMTMPQTMMMNFQESTWWHYFRHSIHSLSSYYRELLFSSVQIFRGHAEQHPCEKPDYRSALMEGMSKQMSRRTETLTERELRAINEMAKLN